MMAAAAADQINTGLVHGVRWDAATHAPLVDRWVKYLPRRSKHTSQPFTFRLDELWGDAELANKLHECWQTTEWSGNASRAEQEGVPVRVTQDQDMAAMLWIRALAQLTGCIIRQHHDLRTVTLADAEAAKDVNNANAKVTFVPFGSASSATIKQLHAEWKSPSYRATTFWHIARSPYDEQSDQPHRTAWPLHAPPPPAQAVDAILNWMTAQLAALAPQWSEWCHEACFLDTRVGTGMFVSRFPAGRRGGWEFDAGLAGHAAGMIYPDPVWHMTPEIGVSLEDFQTHDAKGRWPRERRVAVCHPPGDDETTVWNALVETLGVADHVFLILPARRSYLPVAFVRLDAWETLGVHAVATQQANTLQLELTLSAQPNGRFAPQRYQVLYYRTTPTTRTGLASTHQYGPARSRHSQRRGHAVRRPSAQRASPRNNNNDDDDDDDVVVSPCTPDSPCSSSAFSTPTPMRVRDTYQPDVRATNQVFKDDSNNEFVRRIMTLEPARRSDLRVFYLDGAGMGTTQALQNPPLGLSGHQLFIANRCCDTLAAIHARCPTLNTFAGEALEAMTAFGDVADSKFDAMYLDFCGTWATCSTTIERALQVGLRRNLEDATRVVLGFTVLAARQPRPDGAPSVFALVQTAWASLLAKHGWSVDLCSDWLHTPNHMVAHFAVLKPVSIVSDSIVVANAD